MLKRKLQKKYAYAKKDVAPKNVATTSSNVTAKLIYSAAESVQHENNFNAASKIYEYKQRNAKKKNKTNENRQCAANQQQPKIFIITCIHSCVSK